MKVIAEKIQEKFPLFRNDMVIKFRLGRQLIKWWSQVGSHDEGQAP
jgi:hypothetical protein